MGARHDTRCCFRKLSGDSPVRWNYERSFIMWAGFKVPPIKCLTRLRWRRYVFFWPTIDDDGLCRDLKTKGLWSILRECLVCGHGVFLFFDYSAVEWTFSDRGGCVNRSVPDRVVVEFRGREDVLDLPRHSTIDGAKWWQTTKDTLKIGKNQKPG